MSCEYCYEKLRIINSSNINIDNTIDFINKFDYIDELVFFGGEPLIEYENIFNIINGIKSKVYKYFISTNGVLLDKTKYNKLIENKIKVQYSIHNINNITLLEKDIFYHITLNGDDVDNLLKLYEIGFLDSYRVWISINRYSKNEFLIDDFIRIKNKDIDAYLSILKSFKKVKHVGKDCCCYSGNGILYNCCNGDTYPCANLMYLNEKHPKPIKECLYCKNDYCTACVCDNLKNGNSKKIICEFFKFIKKEKIKYDV